MSSSNKKRNKSLIKSANEVIYELQNYTHENKHQRNNQNKHDTQGLYEDRIIILDWFRMIPELPLQIMREEICEYLPD